MDREVRPGVRMVARRPRRHGARARLRDACMSTVRCIGIAARVLLYGDLARAAATGVTVRVRLRD